VLFLSSTLPGTKVHSAVLHPPSSPPSLSPSRTSLNTNQPLIQWLQKRHRRGTKNYVEAQLLSSSRPSSLQVKGANEANELARRQDASETPSSTSPVPSAQSPSPTDSPPAPTSKPVGVLLPQNQPNPTLRHFPYAPVTGANNSLYITPNVTSTDGLVEIKIGVLLPYSLPNNLTQQLTYR